LKKKKDINPIKKIEESILEWEDDTRRIEHFRGKKRPSLKII